MNKQKATGSENHSIPLRGNIETMVHAAWQLTHHSLWPHIEKAWEFEENVKKFIKAKITSGRDPFKNYLEYCQRVLLCWKILVEEYAFGQTDLPTAWFDPKNPNGFKVSDILFSELEKQRKKDPLINYEVKALPEAILEMTEFPCRINFNYWKNWFAERYAYDEYILFYQCCIQNSHNFKY